MPQSLDQVGTPMRFESELGTIEVDREEVDRARDGLHAVRDLAEAVGLVDRGPCEQCGDMATRRPLAVKNDQGEAVLSPVCAKCQTNLAEERLKQAEARDQADQIVAEAKAEANRIVAEAEARAEELADARERLDDEQVAEAVKENVTDAIGADDE